MHAPTTSASETISSRIPSLGTNNGDQGPSRPPDTQHAGLRDFHRVESQSRESESPEAKMVDRAPTTSASETLPSRIFPFGTNTGDQDPRLHDSFDGAFPPLAPSTAASPSGQLKSAMKHLGVGPRLLGGKEAATSKAVIIGGDDGSSEAHSRGPKLLQSL